MSKPLRVMKFGGTSVSDASCISRVAQIVRDASREGPVVAVVSAMSGVTNRLIEAANRSEAGEREEVSALFEALRKQHQAALATLIPTEQKQGPLAACLRGIFSERERLWRWW